MSEIVFILGAGASKEAGAPEMKDFLATARQLFRSGQEDNQAFATVFNTIDALREVIFTKSDLDLNNIEDLFAAFEMGQLINKLPDINDELMKKLPSFMKKVIVRTLERSISYPVGKGFIGPPESYNSFAKLVRALNRNGTRCSIISFNYDIALDYALHFNHVSLNYGLSSYSKEVTALLKLHGSVNWAKCSNSRCGRILPWDIGDLTKKWANRSIFHKGKPSTELIIGSLSDTGITHCEEKVEPEPVIIPPTWNKQKYYQDLSAVWANAAKELSEAENIFVIGYSFPRTDVFFHHLYAIGSLGRTPISRFWVFNPNEDVFSGFGNIIGRDIERGKFKTLRTKFSDSIGGQASAIDTIALAFGVEDFGK